MDDEAVLQRREVIWPGSCGKLALDQHCTFRAGLELHAVWGRECSAWRLCGQRLECGFLLSHLLYDCKMGVTVVSDHKHVKR